MQTKKQKQEIRAQEIDRGEQILRLRAELDNIRKRTEQDKINLVKFANANLISDILPVLDNFKRAAMHSPITQDENSNSWIAGVQAIEKQLEDVLKQNGLEEISVNIGDIFDHNLHEALSHEKGNNPEDKILEIIENGYKLNGKIIRPTKVKVSS